MTHDFKVFDKFQMNFFFYVPCDLFLTLDCSQKMCYIWNHFIEINVILNSPIAQFTLANTEDLGPPQKLKRQLCVMYPFVMQSTLE